MVVQGRELSGADIDQISGLIGEQTLLIEQLRTENADLRQQLDEALQAGKRQAHPFRRRTYMDNSKRGRSPLNRLAQRVRQRASPT